MRQGIFRNLWNNIDTLITGRGKIGEEQFEQLEETLLASDISVRTTDRILTELRKRAFEARLSDANSVKQALMELMTAALGDPKDAELKVSPVPPTLYLMVGVNGVGKTTSLGKLAYMNAQAGKKVMLVAGDTFRAAAAEQLGIWAERAGADFIRQHERSDPAAVVFDAISAAKTRGTDLILVDTAGRLHNKGHLMEELRKIGRICEKELGRKPDEVLLALDATTGQNAIQQAKEFIGAVGVTGIFLSKMDGTARGGIIISVREELGLPVKLVGFGEQPEDLIGFDPEFFIGNLLDMD